MATTYKTAKKSKKEQKNVLYDENDEMEEDMEDEDEDKNMKKKGKDYKKDKNDVKINLSDFSPVIQQIQKEYKFAYEYIKPKWDAWQVRLKLYNNQKRDAEAIGDPLLFTIFQTVLASLYTDQLTVEFVGREHGDDECAENQTILAQYDQEEMEKEILDYEWMWDTLFFGRGLVLMDEWDGETNTPIPQVIDPLTFFRDPDAHSVNGDKKKRNAARFMGREIRMTRYELESCGLYQNIDQLRADPSNRQTEVEQNQNARREAQGFDKLRDDLSGDNSSYILHEWWTHFNGKKYVFTLGKERTVLLRVKEIKTKKWPIIDRQIFATAHDWDGVSVPDLVEDKQRARAVLMNLGLKGVKARMYPNYTYDRLRIKNKADLLKLEFNKHIPVEGPINNVISPIEKQPVTSEAQWMLEMMDFASQKATATPDIQQGAFQEKVKSATEIAQVSQGVDTRYSLSAKIFGWSEKRFWKLWYELYTIYFRKGIHKKMARIAGPFGPSYREILPDTLIGSASSDIMIESKTISDAKRMNKMNMWMAATNQGVSLDPNFNRRFALQQTYKAMGMTTDEINRILPKTFDEIEAETENFLLEKGELPKVLMSQNHLVHLEIHSKAADNEAKQRHIDIHKLALYGITHNPALKKMKIAEGEPEAPAVEVPPTINGAPSPMEQGTAPAPRDMAQSALQLQAPTAVQQAQ